jgi:hypothetical protein
MEDGMAIKFQVTFDCLDPDRVARFWAEALGYKVQDPPPGFATWPQFLESIGVPREEWNSRSAVVDPEGIGPRLFFGQVDEKKTVKNRVHLDVSVSGGPLVPLDERRAKVAEAVTRMIALGATRVETFDERGEHWVVMQDVEGNEFCLT